MMTTMANWKREMKAIKSNYIRASVTQKNDLPFAQRAIDKLPKTLATLGESIQRQTGWNISFLVGGPEPRQNGQIITYM